MRDFAAIKAIQDLVYARMRGGFHLSRGFAYEGILKNYHTRDLDSKGYTTLLRKWLWWFLP